MSWKVNSAKDDVLYMGKSTLWTVVACPYLEKAESQCLKFLLLVIKGGQGDDTKSLNSWAQVFNHSVHLAKYHSGSD